MHKLDTITEALHEVTGGNYWQYARAAWLSGYGYPAWGPTPGPWYARAAPWYPRPMAAPWRAYGWPRGPWY